MSLRKRLIVSLTILLVIFIIAIVGYIVIEKQSILNAVYMTVITITSVGFQEVWPLSASGKIFTIFILVVGFGVLLYTISTVTAFIVEGELKDILRRRKMQKRIDRLNNHYIVCGVGETGLHIIKELIATQKPFVVIEDDPDRIEKINEISDILYLVGDATEDTILLKSGIKRACGLFCVLPNDPDNLFVTLTARELNPNLRIVARVVEERSIPKLVKTGANAVISPTSIGGLRMASEMIRPAVVSFLDSMLRPGDMQLRFEEVEVVPDSSFIGKTLGEARVREKSGLIVIAIRDAQEKRYICNPEDSTRLKERDTLIVMGSPDQVGKLHNLIHG